MNCSLEANSCLCPRVLDVKELMNKIVLHCSAGMTDCEQQIRVIDLG